MDGRDRIALAEPDLQIPAGSDIAETRRRVSPAEWIARVELAALYRLVAHFKWTDTVYNHISLRCPEEECLLINPFGYLYDEITASSLVKIDIEGKVLDDPTGFGINPAGFVIHGAIHAARHDVACVIHTHTRAGVAVAAQKHGLLPISGQAAVFHNRVGYHAFEGIVVNLDERERLVANLGARSALILRNHGLLTAGRSAAEALYLMLTLERACEIQVAALSGGLDQVGTIEIAALEQVSGLIAGADLGRDWAAMLRLARRVAPDYDS